MVVIVGIHSPIGNIICSCFGINQILESALVLKLMVRCYLRCALDEAIDNLCRENVASAVDVQILEVIATGNLVCLVESIGMAITVGGKGLCITIPIGIAVLYDKDC